jgi:3-oxosteroid 1-dehydrogenase
MWLIFDDDYWSSAVRSQQAGPIRSDCVIADTLENLAEQVGIDPIGLRKTVDRLAGSKKNGRYLDTEACAVSSLGEWVDHMRLNRSASKTEMAGISGRGDDERRNDTLVAGEALAAHFVRAPLAAGAEMWIDSPAIRLIAKAGDVVGLSIATQSGTRSVRAARGVLLATGGYDHNKRLLSRFEGNFEPRGTLSPPGVTGDHLIMGGDVGAAITVLPPVRAAVTNGLFTDSLDDCGDRITALYWPVGLNTGAT